MLSIMTPKGNDHHDLMTGIVIRFASVNHFLQKSGKSSQVILLGWFTMELSDIEDAFFFVGGASYGEHSAMINKKTGKVYYQSEMGDLDEIPVKIDEPDSRVEVPHQNDLGLGRELVFKFVAQRLLADFEQVQMIFHKRGAYYRYKDLLDQRGLLQEWFNFENAREKEAIREWCLENSIDISDC